MSKEKQDNFEGITTVHMPSGKTLHYSVSPEKAIRNAYIQTEFNDHNTWDYEKYKVNCKKNKNIIFFNGYYVNIKKDIFMSKDSKKIKEE